MNRIILLVILIGFFAFSVKSQGIITTSFYAIEDAYIRNGAANTGSNYGSLTELIASNGLYSLSPVSYFYTRSLVKFDLSTVPSNAIITSAKLRLRIKSESLTASGSTELYLDLANSTWSEGTVTNNSAISNNINVATVTLSNKITITDFAGSREVREFDVKSHVQALVENRIPNHGWRIKRNPESGTLTPAIYYSKEHLPGNSYFYPELEVQYYLPVWVNTCYVVNASNTTSSDGAIYPTVADGSSASKTYQWYKYTSSTLTAISGATNLNLVSQPYGWYGLRVTGADPSDVSYHGFIIGVRCATFSILVPPEPSYIDDSYLDSGIQGAGTTAIYKTQVNYGTSSVLLAMEFMDGDPFSEEYNLWAESLLRFRLWFDPNYVVNSANLTLYGEGHSTVSGTNDAKLKLVTRNWRESGVAWTNKPSSVDPPSVAIGSITGNSNAVINIKSLVDYWKINSTQNFGCHLQLNTYYNDGMRAQRYRSSDAAVGTRPSLTLNLTSAEGCSNTNLYYVPEESIGPEIVDLPNANKTLRIRYKDYYDSDGQLNYSIKCLTDDSPVTLILVSKNANTNWISINLNSAGLALGKVYLLELKDNNGKKEYLKFKVVN